MIQKLSDYKIKLLNRISPSQYYSATNCPYKLALANSVGYTPLIPLNANAHFGSIIHKMIELISKNIIYNEQTFSENWVTLISKKEIELKESGLANIVPLKYFVTNFALKKNQIKKVLQKRQEKNNHATKTFANKFYPEKRLENTDRSIIGIADLIIENELGATILDFKTGKIYSDSIDESGITDQIIKDDYEVQLKIYAYLYFLTTGKYPTSLFIVNLLNDFIEVKFNSTDCQKIYFEALNFLKSTNSFIEKNEFSVIAKPSVENCKYCSYRPACTFYTNWLNTNFEMTRDLFGIIEKVNQFNNDTLGLQLLTNGKNVLINGLSIADKESFDKSTGNTIVIYNLKKAIQTLNATAGYFTIIYEQKSQK